MPLTLPETLPLADLTPAQTAAFWRLGYLTPVDLEEVATIWLERGLDKGSPEVAGLALDPPFSPFAAQAAFEAALVEMGVAVPADDRLVLTVLEVFLRAMIERRMAVMAAMAAINELYYQRGEARLSHPNRAMDEGETYLGAELGLEPLYGWYRELQDAEDDPMLACFNELPPARQQERLVEELISEARILHGHLCATHPEIGGSSAGD